MEIQCQTVTQSSTETVISRKLVSFHQTIILQEKVTSGSIFTFQSCIFLRLERSKVVTEPSEIYYITTEIRRVHK